MTATVHGIEFAAEKPLPPSIPDSMFRIVRLDGLEKIARFYINGEITEDDAARRIAILSHPDLSEEARWAGFEELCGALQFRQQVDDGDITVCEVEPELADPAVLTEAAYRAVEDALQELVGGAR